MEKNGDLLWLLDRALRSKAFSFVAFGDIFTEIVFTINIYANAFLLIEKRFGVRKYDELELVMKWDLKNFYVFYVFFLIFPLN